MKGLNATYHAGTALIFMLGIAAAACSPPLDGQVLSSNTEATSGIKEISESSSNQLSARLSGPNIDSMLYKIAYAYENGDLDTFNKLAASSNVIIRGTSILVEIRCAPGKLDSVIQIVRDYGCSIGSIGRYSNGFDALVPLTQLKNLVKEQDIYSVSLPILTAPQ